MSSPRTLGELRRSSFSEQQLATRHVKDELRENLTTKLRLGGSIFPGIVGYDDTVVPQIVNAILSRHNFILLGLRGQAKSRILRALTSLLDPQLPYIEGCEIHDNPYAPSAGVAVIWLQSVATRPRLHTSRRKNGTLKSWPPRMSPSRI